MHAVIGIDVSKATSQVAVAVDGKVVRNFKITHDVFGFNWLNWSLCSLIRSQISCLRRQAFIRDV